MTSIPPTTDTITIELTKGYTTIISAEDADLAELKWYALEVTNTSGYKGVYWDKRAKKWQAKIVVDGKQIHLSGYSTPEAAYAAYCEAAKRLHGEFHNLG